MHSLLFSDSWSSFSRSSLRLSPDPKLGFEIIQPAFQDCTDDDGSLLGLKTYGVDSNPVAAAIAQAKLVSVHPDDVVSECSSILRQAKSQCEMPVGDFWTLCFHPMTLADLCALRSALLADCSSPSRIALRALLLGRLHGPTSKGEPSYLSNQMPRTYASKPDYAVRYWRRAGMKPRPVDTQSLVRRYSPYYFANLPPAVQGEVFCADAREFAFSEEVPKIDWVVTSPPYYGMKTYVPDQWLRLWLLGGPARV